MPGPDCRKSPEPAVFADDQFYLERMKEILQQSWTVADGSSVEGYHTSSYGLQLQPVQLLDHVFIGSQRNADNLEVLRSNGITHVLNCAGLRRYDFTRSPYPKDTGIKAFLMFPAEDNEDYDMKRHFSEAIAFLDEVKRLRGRSLVHCNLGVNRSGAVVAAYLMVSERRTLLDVIRYLRSKRSVVLSNKGFRRQLVVFARERGLLDPIINYDKGEYGINNNSLQMSSYNGRRSVSQSSIVTPSVVVSDATDLHHSTYNGDGSHTAVESSQNGRRYWTTRQSSLLLSPVYEQPAESSSSSSGVLGGFLTLFGAGAGRRRPLRSTSFSNVSTCSAGNATTFTTVTTSGTAGTATGSPEEPRATLSTARPLRVYTRSSTDTELYRRGRPPRPPTSHVIVRQRFSEQHGRPVD